MARDMKIHDPTSLTIGDTTYKTSGNILFSDAEEHPTFMVAESHLLDKMDSAIQKGIVENGMQSLMRKFNA